MKASLSGRRTSIAWLVGITLGLTLVASAAVAPIDFSGHWTGAATDKTGSTTPLVADLTSSGKTVTGTVSFTQDGQLITCTLDGKQKGKAKIKVHLTPCKTVLQGKFDETTDTIDGHYVTHGNHRTKKGTFTLTRGASPSGAFID
jgi:hypothetical protein